MKLHLDQSDPKYKHSRMTCMAFVQLELDLDGIYAIIDNQMLKTPHDILVHLSTLDYGRKPDIVTLKKEKGDVFLEFCTKIFKAKFLCYINEVQF